jgi:hypothetical protein
MAADRTARARSRVQSDRAWLPTGLLLSAGAAALVAVHLDALRATSDGTPVWRLTILTALSVTPLVAVVARRGAGLMSPVVLVSLYFLTAYALRGWAIDARHEAGSDVTARVARSLPGYLIPSIDITIVALAAFYLGYLCIVSPAIAGYLPRPREPIDRIQLPTASWGLLLVGLPCFALNAIAPERVRSSGFSEVLFNLSALALVGFAFLAISARSRGDRGSGTSPWVPTALFLFLLVGGVVEGSKATVLWVLLAGAVALYYGRRRLPIVYVGAAAAAFVFIFFPTIQTLRNVLNEPDRPSVPRALARLPDRIVSTNPQGLPRENLTPDRYIADALLSTTGRLYGLDTLVVARALTPNTHPYLGGSTYARLPASLVPRVLWPGKPELSFANEFADDYWGRSTANDQSAQPVGVVGELYINWGVPAVFVGMFMLGFGYRLWYSWLARRWSPLAIALYVVSVPTMVQIEGDAVFLFRTGLNRVIVALVCLVLLGWALSLFDRRRRETATTGPRPFAHDTSTVASRPH